MTASITLYRGQNPDVYPKSKLYDPTNPASTGNVVPAIDSLIVDDTVMSDGSTSRIIKIVESVDGETLASTLVDARMVVTEDGVDSTLSSIVSYKNDIFRVFFDTRTTPIHVVADRRIKVYGIGNEKYQIVRYPNTDHEVVISRFYDSNGTYTGNAVPLKLIDETKPNSERYCADCDVEVTLIEGEELRIDIYNTHGAQTASITVFAKEAQIINELIDYTPTITSMTLSCAQSRGNGEFYIFQKQSIESLNIYATLHYEDGHSQDIVIDNLKTFIYGVEDFVASYPGLQQQIMVKYFMSDLDVATPGLISAHPEYIVAKANLVVVSNELAAGVKISTIPKWNPASASYSLKYYMYTTDRDTVKDVTSYVTIANTTFNGSAYGIKQSLILNIDMHEVFPLKYTGPVIYSQTVIITLQPITSNVQFTIQDSSNANYVYGIDVTTSRRPVLHYDSSRGQYYIPSTLFQNEAAFIQSFYTHASPLYNTVSETQPITPDRFIIRDINTGAVVTNNPIPIAQYAEAFNLFGTAVNGGLVGTTCVIEFLKEINTDTYLILYGSPVMVFNGVYSS